jgi:hypothetical protein
MNECKFLKIWGLISNLKKMLIFLFHQIKSIKKLVPINYKKILQVNLFCCLPITRKITCNWRAQ